MTVAVEREAKLSADADFVLPDLTGAVDDLAAIPAGEEVLSATYFDTPDLRLIRWGISLRYRVEGGAAGRWTLKLPADSDRPAAAYLARQELEVEGAPFDIPAGLVDLVQAVVRGAPLGPVARLETVRRKVELRDRQGARVAEIDDDMVRVLEGNNGGRTFREIEVELAEAGGPRVLDRAVRRLTQAGAHRNGARPKVAQALGSRAEVPPEVVVEDLPRRRASVGDAVRRAVAAGTRRLILHDPGVRLGEDPEDVHQARVATRRLRSDLRTFKPALEEGPIDAVRAELKWLAQHLGAVRDADVLLERLREDAASVDPDDRAAADALLVRVAQERNQARQALLAALRSSRYLALLDSLIGLANEPPLTDDARWPARTVLPKLVRRPWRRLARGVASLPGQPSDAELHGIRILAKRCRYAAEAAAPVIGPPAVRLAEAVEELQTVLGDLHDAVVAGQWLRSASRRSAPQALVAGQLIVLEQARVAAGRAVWPDVWRAARKKKLRAWLR